MNMGHREIIGGLLCFCCWSTVVTAAPAAGGETGNLMTPSADMMRPGQFHAGWYEQAGQQHLAAAAALNCRWEISALRRTGSDASHAEVGFKYALRSENVLTPGLAVGAEDVTANRRRSFYAVMSKTLPYGMRLHAGVGNGRYAGGFAAFEVRLLPKADVGRFPDASVYAEHVDGHAAYGVRMALFRGMKLALGVDGHEHFVGISYNFY